MRKIRRNTPSIIHQAPLYHETETAIAKSAASLAKGYKHLWQHEDVQNIHEVHLTSIDRLGGQPGYSGSRVFVAAMRAKRNRGGLVRQALYFLRL